MNRRDSEGKRNDRKAAVVALSDGRKDGRGFRQIRGRESDFGGDGSGGGSGKIGAVGIV